MALRLPRLRVNRTWLMLGIAIVLGLVATWLTLQYLKVRERRMSEELAASARGGPTMKVVVPVRDLQKGMTVNGDVVAAREVQTDLVPADAITPDMFAKYDGSKLLKPVLRGRPLLATDVDERDKDFSDLLEEGHRAITINVDDLNSISQMVRPGNLVDLFLILPDMSDASVGNNQQIVLLMQRLKVIATGQTVRKGAAEVAPPGTPPGMNRYTTFTFDVTPEQAARIALAQQLGTFRAVLRSEPDQEMVRVGRINTRNLLRKGYSDEVPEERDEGSVEFIIGGKSSGGGVGNTVTVNVPGLLPSASAAPATGGATNPAIGAASVLPPVAQQYVPTTPVPAAR